MLKDLSNAPLAGMGGIGKTALALIVAHKLAPQYPDAQIYLDLKGTSQTPLHPIEAMLHVIHAFEPQADLRKATKDEIGAIYRSTLASKRVLLLMDNAANAEQVKPLLPPSSSALLVTSRLLFTLPGLQPLHLDVMPKAEARDLLLRLCARTENCAEEITRLCGYLPLAIRIAGSTLAEHVDLSCSDYVARLADHRTRLATLKSENDPDLNVEASFELSYALLLATQQITWRALAVFPAPFNWEAAAEVWDLSNETTRRYLSELVRFSLVEYDEANGRYSLHNLLAEFADKRLSKRERKNAQTRHARYYLKVAEEADTLYEHGGIRVLRGLALFDTERIHIQVGQAWATSNCGTSDEALRLCNEYPNAAYEILSLRLHPHEYIKWLEVALAAAQKLREKQYNISHLGNLGIAYSYLGDARKAVEYHEQALAITREIGDRRHEGNQLGNLGIAYSDLGDARKAIEYYEQALAITREIGNQRNEGNQLGNLGTAYSHLGDTREAIEYYEQALAVAREIGDRRNEGNQLGNLGTAYSDLGDARKAIEFYEQALALAREIGDRRNEGNQLGNLGLAYEDLGEPRKAIEYYAQALAISREIGDRGNEGYNLGNLGLTHADLGEAQKAIDYYEQALAIAREIGERRAVGFWLGSIGKAHQKQGTFDKAIEYCDQALAIAREIGDRQNEGKWLNSLGAVYGELGETDKAIQLTETALKILEATESTDAQKARQQLEKLKTKQNTR